MRVLIAEDEVEIAKALKVMLERSKYSVDIVHNGNDAYDYITMSTYDAIVLDIMMPGMDGLTVLEKVRSEGVSTPVLFLTAKGQLDDRVAGLNAGADDYLAEQQGIPDDGAVYASSPSNLFYRTSDGEDLGIRC